MTNSERLERVETEIFNVQEALEYLNGVRGVENAARDLKERLIVLGFEREECERLAYAEDMSEIRALRMEYERDLI